MVTTKRWCHCKRDISLCFYATHSNWKFYVIYIVIEGTFIMHTADMRLYVFIYLSH